MENILVIIGGVSRDSLNKKFFAELEKLAPKSLVFSVFDIASLPFYSQDLEEKFPEKATELKRAIEMSDAILFVTPEYNRSMPGVLKNAIDWASRPASTGTAAPSGSPAGSLAGSSAGAPGQLAANSWAGKPAAIVGATPGAMGTFGAQQHLRNILSFLDLRVMNQPTVYFNSTTGMNGNSLTDSSIAFLQKFWTAFESWIDGQQAAQKPQKS